MKTRLSIVFFAIFSVLYACPGAEATSYELKTITPAVQSALDGRQQRYAEVQMLKARGKLGEGRQGYVVALMNASEIVQLAKVENADRRAIYRAIADQNSLGSSGLTIVEGVFAEVQHERAKPGERIQRPSGDWVTVS